jgi:4-hydroxy-4-methyl-2-oxoglutarate aldolase
VSAADLLALGTATVGEAWPAARLVSAPLRPLAPGMVLAGTALPVRCTPGDVLVVDYGGSLDSGPFGEIMALACQMRGIAGLVINGAVRDSAQIAALGFPVFARGLNIRGTVKQDRGMIGAPVTLGGVTVTAGDLVLADADAILLLDAQDLAPALSVARARAAREARMMERLRQGETTLSILGLEGETGT